MTETKAMIKTSSRCFLPTLAIQQVRNGEEFKEGVSDGNESCFKDKHISLDLSLFFCFFTPSWNAESEVNLKH